jgi:hypothetical protein
VHELKIKNRLKKQISEMEKDNVEIEALLGREAREALEFVEMFKNRHHLNFTKHHKLVQQRHRA